MLPGGALFLFSGSFFLPELPLLLNTSLRLELKLPLCLPAVLLLGEEEEEEEELGVEEEVEVEVVLGGDMGDSESGTWACTRYMELTGVYRREWQYK